MVKMRSWKLIETAGLRGPEASSLSFSLNRKSLGAQAVGAGPSGGAAAAAAGGSGAAAAAAATQH
jgi:hypothetical protein